MQKVSEKRLYNLARWSAQLLLKWLFGLEIRGLEYIPKSGPVIIMSNHASYLDPIIVGSAADRELHYMAKDTLFFGRIIGGFLRHVNAYPVKRGAPDRAALKNTLSILKMGGAVLIFPEGARGEGRNLGEAKSGAGFIVYHSEAKVVPALIKGSQEAWGRGQRFPRCAKISVRFGKPIDLEDLRNLRATRELYDDIGKRIMRHISFFLSPPHA